MMMKILQVCMLILATGIVSYAQDTTTHYVVEVVFVVEPELIRRYQEVGYAGDAAKKEIKGDLIFYVFEANKLYASLATYDLYIELRIHDIYWPTEEVFQPADFVPTPTGKRLKTNLGLKRFRTWLDTNEVYKWVGYDIAIILTGYGFKESAAIDASGKAYVGEACKKDFGLGLLQFEGSGITPEIMAHEIGHVLGASHDGNGNTCSGKAGNTMCAGASWLNKERWSFSSCSKDYFIRYIKSLDNTNNNCLIKTTDKKSTYSFQDAINRDALIADKICQRVRTSTKAYACNLGAKSKGDAVCKILYCHDPSSGQCYPTVPIEGMTCNPNKRCKKGKCVAS